MKVLSVAYPMFPVNADSAGGAEQILYLLEGGLVRRGIESIVIGVRGSNISGTLVETPTVDYEITEQEHVRLETIYCRTIADTLDAFPIDLVHFHGLDFEKYLPKHRIPKVVTLHLPISWYSSQLFDWPEVDLVCVSKSQASSAPAGARVRVVANGIDTTQYCPMNKRGNSLLWLGRICPEKGVHLALEVAHRLDVPLTIAGPVHPFSSHQAYFREQVESLLDAKRVWVGAVTLPEKRTLLREALALLAPSLVAETSSLVAMEAACSGTPVIAFRSGALPEVVEHGVTGFIVDDQDQMVDAVRRIGDLSSSACRKHALENFSADCMVDKYVNLYREVIGV